MHWIAKLMIIIGGNALGLWLASRVIPGFFLSDSIPQLIFIAFILVLLNAVLKPIFMLVFGPIVILTLGLGIIVVNAAILLVLKFLSDNIDFLHGSITIQNIPALIYATLLLSVINFIVHVGT